MTDKAILKALETVKAIEKAVIDDFKFGHPNEDMSKEFVEERIRLTTQVYCANVMMPYPLPDVI